jgi:hypothetical protein
MFSLVGWQGFVSLVKLVSQNFFAEFKDAVNVLCITLVIFQDIEQPDKLFVIHKLAQKTDFAHR